MHGVVLSGGRTARLASIVRVLGYERAMQKRLAVVGNSLALVIDKSMRNALGITKNTELLVRTDGRRLVIEPVRLDEPVAKLSAAVFESGGELSLAEQLDARAVFQILLNRFEIQPLELARLHHAPLEPLASSRTILRYSSWMAAGHLKKADARETATVRRLRYCLDALLAGAPFERAIELALLAFPLSLGTAADELREDVDQPVDDAVIVGEARQREDRLGSV